MIPGDFLTLPNLGDANSSQATFNTATGILVRRVAVYRDIEIHSMFVEVTSSLAGSKFGIGLYDLQSLRALLLFNGISGANPTGVRFNQVPGEPLLLRAGVYGLAFGQDQGSSLSLRGCANDALNLPLTKKAVKTIGAGGILPATLGGFLATTTSTCPYVIFA